MSETKNDSTQDAPKSQVVVHTIEQAELWRRRIQLRVQVSIHVENGDIASAVELVEEIKSLGEIPSNLFKFE